MRPVADADMDEIRGIYEDAVLNTAATFEETLPDRAETDAHIHC